MKKDINKNFKGFTMMETVVCLAVFAVTLAAAVPAFEEFNEKTDEHNFRSECKSILATAEVMAGESYKLGTDEAKLMADLQDQFPDCKIGNVVFEKGKVLSLEINRKANPRTMYYTDEGDFSTEKPADFERIKERSLARLAGFTPYEAPADPKIIPERTKPAVTTAPETVAATEPTTTTVTTPKPVTTVTTTETTTEVTPKPNPQPTPDDKPVTNVEEDNKPVETTTSRDLRYIGTEDYSVMMLSNIMEDTNVIPLSLDKMSSGEWSYNTIYKIGDLKGDGRILSGIGVKFAEQKDSTVQLLIKNAKGGEVARKDISSSQFENGYYELSICQDNFDSPPDTIEIINYNPYAELSAIEDVYLFFTQYEILLEPSAELVNPHSNTNKYNLDKNRFDSIDSVTIVFDDFLYVNNVYGAVVMNKSNRRSGFNLSRKDGMTVTVPINPDNSDNSFTIEWSAQNPKISAVYINYK